MTKSDISELKKRIKKENCSFHNISGCYVNSAKEKVTTFTESYQTMDDEAQLKYVEIAKKIFSGTVDNNLITLDFAFESELAAQAKQMMLAVRDSKLNDEGILGAMMDHIIENYSYPGNYLILIFHDIYDVPVKTSDGNFMDESNDVYDYILTAICPVTLSKPGLGYLIDENKIGPRIRDWVVGMPESGFVYPAFNDRSADVESLLFYNKDASDPHNELVGDGMGCVTKRTITEKQHAFTSIVKSALGEDADEVADTVMDIQTMITEYVEENSDWEDGVMVDTETGVIITAEDMKELMQRADVEEGAAGRIAEKYAEEFEELPPANHLVDERKYKASVRARDEAAARNYDVVLKCRPEKVSQITSQEIDGRRCIVIPMEDNEHAAVNGSGTLL